MKVPILTFSSVLMKACLISFCEPQASFSSNCAWFFSIIWKVTLLYFFMSKVIYFAWIGPIKVKIFETFNCLDQISPNSCHFWNNKLFFFSNFASFFSVMRQLLCTFLAKIVYTFNKRSLLKYNFGQINLQFDGLLLSKTYKNLDEKVKKSYVSWHLM